MAVDRSKFRTCSQTSFCRRHRNGRSKPAYQYKLDPATIQFSPSIQEVVPSDNNISKEEKEKGDMLMNSSSNNDPEALDKNNDDKKSASAAVGNNGQQSYMQKIKTLITRNKSAKNQKGQGEEKDIVDPYRRGPQPFFTAKLVNEALITSTGNSETLNLAIHLHEDGVARIRITEEYYDEKSDSSSSSKKNMPYSDARWTSDELVLNYEEMKHATQIQPFDQSTQEGKELLNKLVSTLNLSLVEDNANFIAFRYGNHAGAAKDVDGSCNSSSLFLIQFQPFTLHLWRDICKEVALNEHQFGPPIVSVNTDNLMHFEIRRSKEAEKNELNQEVIPNQGAESVLSEESLDLDVNEESIDADKEKDRHGGKEIVGYWEDGLAIYADGTREERKEDEDNSIVQEKRRVLMDGSAGDFQFDTDGMWEEKFGGHVDSKPFGPMSVGADISFPGSSHLFGLPEHASSTQLKSTSGEGSHYNQPYRLYNLDVFEYELDETMALYGEVPFIVSQSKAGGTVGVFWFNPTETYVDVFSDETSFEGLKTHWISESGVIDLFLLPGPNPKSLYQQYATLTGRMPLPPMWSLGYHQCRWNYRDEEDVFQVHGKFEELDYPYDVLWLDIEHTDGKRYFTWDKNLFPAPIPMQEKLSSQGRKMVTIIDPHIKRDDNYYIHKTATAKGLYIKDKNGKVDYDGWCWPGSSSYLDFTNEKVRSWWAEQFAYKNYVGSTSSLFTWNDMNEPSVFNGPEVSMQKDLRNLDGVEHREWHNLYGMLFHRATSEGLIRRNSGENVRPFVLSRSFFAGR